MKNYFSIGEMSKLLGIASSTLRYYDSIGLLKPNLLGENNNYRFYSVEQFIQIDFIKHCKHIGLSLEEIKKLLDENTSLDSLLYIIDRQKKQVDKSLKEINKINNHLTFLKNRIESTTSQGLNKIFIKYNAERTFLKYEYASSTFNELEANIRKVLLDLEKKYATLNTEMVYTVSYDNFQNNNQTIYNNIMVYINYKLSNSNNLFILPKGNYLTMYLDDNCEDNSKYYKKMIEYIQTHNLKIIGDFREICILRRSDTQGREKILLQLEIMLED